MIKLKFILVARNQDEVKPLAERLGCTFTVADVLQDGFIEKVKTDVTEAKGIAYCIGSIDLKPVRMTKEDDFNKCMKLNLYSAVEAIKGFQDSLRKNKGSIVLFSTAAVHRGFTNHSIIASAKAAVEGLSISLAAEFAPNIRVNCIAPSLTNSKIAQPMLKNSAIADGIAKAHPLKKNWRRSRLRITSKVFNFRGQFLDYRTGHCSRWRSFKTSVKYYLKFLTDQS